MEYDNRTVNQIGSAENAVQARDVGGGIHFHGSAEQRVRELTAELAAVREALAQAHEEIRGLRSYRRRPRPWGRWAPRTSGRLRRPDIRRMPSGDYWMILPSMRRPVRKRSCICWHSIH